MKECPSCESKVSTSALICDCGYDFEQEEITDWDKTRNFLTRPDFKWQEEIKIKQRALGKQIAKHGRSTTSPSSKGWSVRKLAKALKVGHSVLSDDINLAEASDSYPVLLKCTSKAHAKRLFE